MPRLRGTRRPEPEVYPGRLLGTTIAGVYPHLRPAERRVADYVFAHPHEVTGLPIAALARRCSVSQHTVNRFCRTVGVKGYPELKLALAQHLVLAASSLSPRGQRPSGVADIVAQTFRFNIESLESTLALGQSAELEATARLIARCRHVRWFGIGGSAAVCLDATLRLKHLGINADASSDLYDQTVEACWLGKRDVAVGVSHTGESKPVVQALQLARQSGAATVAIVNYPRSTLSQHADHVLLTAAHRAGIGASTTMMASRTAQLALVDAIYALVAVQRTKRPGDPTDRIDAHVERCIRGRQSAGRLPAQP